LRSANPLTHGEADHDLDQSRFSSSNLDADSHAQRSLAHLAGDDSEAINYRSSRLGNGMAPLGWTPMDLQEIHRVSGLAGVAARPLAATVIIADKGGF
jgi:hypothetical protein